MTRQPQIMYINSCISGSVAYKMDPAPVRKKKKTAVSKPRRAKKRVIAIDPIALGGVVVSIALLVLMMVGFARVQSVRNEINALEHYLKDLQSANHQLSEEYHSGYDLEEVEQIALAMGMVPAQQAQQISIHVEQPAQEPVDQASAWDSFFAFLTGLFA